MGEGPVANNTGPHVYSYFILTSSSIQHISLSEGMLPNHASSFLMLLSGVTNDEAGKEIARSLDY